LAGRATNRHRRELNFPLFCSTFFRKKWKERNTD
jgi:hypothetical protein